jgi:hypothetical protein
VPRKWFNRGSRTSNVRITEPFGGTSKRTKPNGRLGPVESGLFLPGIMSAFRRRRGIQIEGLIPFDDFNVQPGARRQEPSGGGMDQSI